MKNTIITHDGPAHRDEFLACSCLMYRLLTQGHQVRVERRDVTVDDLKGRDYVIDTGLIYSPEHNNFDHHQEESDVSNMCAFSLVMRHLLDEETYQAAKNYLGWWDVTTVQDIDGPAAAADLIGVTTISYAGLVSPIEQSILALFSSSVSIEPTSALHNVMLEVGRSTMSTIEGVLSSQNSIKTLNLSAAVVAGVRTLDIRNKYIEYVSSTKRFLNRECSKLECALLLDYNSNKDVTVYRQTWAADMLNLSKASKHPKVVRKPHKSGFYITLLGDTTEEELKEVIELSKLK